ncbi:MAG: parvulin peptidyl-prolyl isomerase [Eggerthellaceae bacterium]|nr:parvulin peptidyl-prolyl isomerase [Eggerthellaceae bacterium]
MIKLSSFKRVGAVAVSAALIATLAGCSGGGSGISDTSQGTAATLNGKPIGEKAITDYIVDFRESMDLTDDDAWAQWMVSNGYTPESVRTEVINYYADQMLYEQAAEENDIKVEQSEIDEALEQAKAMFDSDEEWKEALEQSGMTEEEYVNDILRMSLLTQKLEEAVVSDSGEGTSDAELLAYLQDNAALMDGTKRSSHILFNSADAETAADVLDRINSGELDFAEAAEQYSTDAASAASGGDVGWDATASFVTDYQNALDGLEVNQVSDLVESTYGIHIIKCTDVYNVPEEGVTSLGEVPEEIVETVRTNMSASTSGTSFYTWYTEYREAAELEINPMPSGLSYDVDLSEYESAATNNVLSYDDAYSSYTTDDTYVDDSAAAGSSDAAGSADAAGSSDSAQGSTTSN